MLAHAFDTAFLTFTRLLYSVMAYTTTTASTIQKIAPMNCSLLLSQDCPTGTNCHVNDGCTGGVDILKFESNWAP